MRQSTQLNEYNEALIRKLEGKTLQLDAANRTLRQEIDQRRRVAATQTALLNSLTAQVALIDGTGVIVAVNDAWRNYAQVNALISADSGIGDNYLTTCQQVTGADSSDAMRAAAGIRRVLNAEVHRFSFEYSCESSSRAWFLMVVTPFETEGRTGAVVMHLDISDRKGAEQRLEDSEAEYLLLLNSTAEGIYRLDNDGVCSFCNPTAARMLGYEDSRELLGKRVHEHHHHARADGTAYKTHADDEFFFKVDGTRFPVEYWSHPIIERSKTLGSVVTFLDISERRSLESQFLQSQKMEAVGRLAAGVAHDFNNAMQIILTYGELLAKRLGNDELSNSYNKEIIAAGERAASLTRQLLSFSRKQVLQPMLLDIGILASNMEEMLRRMLGADISLTITREANLRAIVGDQNELEQVLINLVSNARDAMPFGGKLRIAARNVEIGPGALRSSAAKSGSFVMLSVRDTGCGIDQATKARIFEPFFTTKEPGKGAGLGLSTTHDIVNQAGGYIDVQSQHGIGSNFCLYFPSLEVPAAPLHSQSKAAKGKEGT